MAETESLHLEEAAWERLACHEMGPAEREQAVEHLSRCPECSRVYRGLLMLEQEARAFDPGAPAAPSAGRPSWGPKWYAVAALAAGLTALVLVPHGRGPERGTPGTRSAGSSASLELLEPLGTLKSAPERFAWRPVPGADRYRVQVFREDGVPVWTSGELAAAAATPLASLALAPGRYFWQVTALHDGETLGESDLRPFTLAP